MEIKDSRIDAGKAFDWGRTSKEYALFDTNTLWGRKAESGLNQGLLSGGSPFLLLIPSRR
jgi:hypothetical protein